MATPPEYETERAEDVLDEGQLACSECGAPLPPGDEGPTCETCHAKERADDRRYDEWKDDQP